MGICSKKEETKDLYFTPSKDRSCTDVIPLLLYIAGWIAAFVILGEAVNFGGSPYRVVYGVDYRGNICGLDAGFKDTKYAAWPIILPIADNAFHIKVCVNSCDLTNTDTDIFPTPYESWKFYRYCIPKSNLDPEFTSGSETASRAISDLYTTWPVIFCACFVAILFSALYVKLMRHPGARKALVWGAIFLVIIGGFLLGWSLLKYADEAENAEVEVEDRATAAKALGWIVVVLTFVFVLIVFFLRKRIEFALNVLGVTASALTQMKSLIFFPLVPFFILVVFAVYWIITALYLFSVKKSEELTLGTAYNSIPYFQDKGFTTYFKYSWEERFMRLFAYHFFHMLWVVNSIVYLSMMTVSGAIANWYFSAPQTENTRVVGVDVNELSNTPVKDSFNRAWRFHFGSIAFGALLIAIVQFVRAVLMYLSKTTKKSQNRVQKAIYACAIYCLKCLEKCINFINRNALAWVAIRGDPFCKSAVLVFSLIFANTLKVAAINMVGSFVILFGKICVALLTTGTGGMIIMYAYKDDISSSVLPVVIIFILSYIVASLFMGIFETSLDTMLICFLGNDSFAPKGFTDEVNQHSKDLPADVEDDKAVYDDVKNGKTQEQPAAQQQVTAADVELTGKK